jgi:hypothetical protein
MSVIDPSYALTPSEIAFLNPEQFAKKARLGYRPLDTETTVATNPLARAVLAIALLALEAAGDIQLEHEEGKVLFVKTHQLTVTPLRDQSSFPDPSVEHQLHALAVHRGGSGKKAKARDLVHAWIGREDSTPSVSVLDRIPPNMDARGLLDQTKEKKLKILTVVNYSLREETRRYASGADVEAIKGLLSGCEGERPDIWKQLQSEVKRAIEDRDSSGADFD